MSNVRTVMGHRSDRKSVSAALSADEADAVCRQLVPIGETVFGMMDQMQRAGFAGFVPASRFVESYCLSDGDLDAHRRYVIERAKERLGRPYPYRATSEETARFYSSPYMRKLVAERDSENGVSEAELASRYPGEIWRKEVDPCRKALALSRIRQSDVFNQRSQAVEREQHDIIAKEASRYDSSGAGDTSLSDVGARYEFFWEAMSQKTSGLGFQYDKSKSKSGCPIFSKIGGGDWDLCWVIEDPRAFFRGPALGSLELSLELRPRALAGRLSGAHARQFLIFAYQHTIPGFMVAYRQFHSFGELALMIDAHLSLYALIAPAIEAAVKKVLGEQT